MARIRTIKPEFPHSEAIGRISREARLLFILLWTIVDDEGRTRAASRMLASLLYPYDDDAPKLIDKWLSELERAGQIRIYEAENSHYLDIPNWLKHQKIDHPTKSRLPEFRETSRALAKSSRSLATDLGPRPSTLDLGKELNTMSGIRPTRYTEAFEIFWVAYPRTPVMSKKEASGAWKRLSEADQQAATASVPAYKAFLTSKPDHPAVHACRFLSQRRFDGFAAQPKPQNGGGWRPGLPTSEELKAKYAQQTDRRDDPDPASLVADGTKSRPH